MVAGFLITMGTLGDRIGRRKLLLIGAAGVRRVSMLAAFSTSAEMLIASRALLGIAGRDAGALDPVADLRDVPGPRQRTRGRGVDLGLLRRRRDRPVPRRDRARVLLVGLGVPPGAAGDGAAPRARAGVLPEYKDPDAGRLDLSSAAMSLVAVLSVIFGLKQIAQDGIGGLPVVSIVLGLVVRALFVRRQFTLADPLIDLRLFRMPAFSASLAVNVLAIFVAVGYFLFVAQYLQLVLGLSPLAAGLWSVPSAIGFIVGSNLAPRIVRTVRPAYLMAASLAWPRLGLVRAHPGRRVRRARDRRARVDRHLARPRSRVRADDGAHRRLRAAGARRCGLGHLRDRRRAGRRARHLDPGQHRRRDLPRRRRPGPAGDIPAAAAEAARDTLGAALGVAAELPATIGATVVTVARDAFVQGMQVAATISAVVAVGVAILTLVALRDVEMHPDAEEADGASQGADRDDRCGHRTSTPVAEA